MLLGDRIGMAASFARSLYAWHTDGEPLLLSATFAVTNRCNLRCSYCNTPFLDPTDLPLDKVKVLFDRLRSLGVKRLGLTGGEPLVRKDIASIVTLAKQAGFWVTMNSNLLLYPRRKSEVRDVDMFFTSLDGNREHHQAVRGDESYDGVIEAATEIVAEGRRLVAISVATEHNLDDAEGLLEVARKGGFRIHFQPQCTDTSIVRGSLMAGFTNDRYRKFFTKILELKRAGMPVASSTPYLEELAAWHNFTQTAVLDSATRCVASRAFLYVDPKGHAYPCAYTKGKTEPVDMLSDAWQQAVGRDIPCTKCSVGPYLEFNLLFQKPGRMALSVLKSYV